MKQKYLIGQFIILLAMLLGGTMRIHAQAVKCDIAGKVMDENQLPVAYASVALYNEKTPIAAEPVGIFSSALLFCKLYLLKRKKIRIFVKGYIIRYIKSK